MIIGHGDIAKVLNDTMRVHTQDFIFFASGVSNSQETRESEYTREFDLLLQQDTSKHLVYFSSLSIFYSDTRYARHKKQMEEVIKSRFKHYTIIRIGNIDWGTNPHTIINFIRNKIINNEKFEVQNVFRYVVSADEFTHWIDLIPDWNCEMNIPGRRMLVKEIVKEYGYTN